MLYTQRENAENCVSFEGAWERTKVDSGHIGIVNITGQGADGFTFRGQFYYYGHSGFLEGKRSLLLPVLPAMHKRLKKLCKMNICCFFCRTKHCV